MTATPQDFVGAGEACDLLILILILILIFRLRFNCLEKDRSLASLDSSYRPSGSKLCRHKRNSLALGTIDILAIQYFKNMVQPSFS